MSYGSSLFGPLFTDSSTIAAGVSTSALTDVFGISDVWIGNGVSEDDLRFFPFDVTVGIGSANDVIIGDVTSIGSVLTSFGLTKLTARPEVSSRGASEVKSTFIKLRFFDLNDDRKCCALKKRRQKSIEDNRCQFHHC